MRRGFRDPGEPEPPIRRRHRCPSARRHRGRHSPSIRAHARERSSGTVHGANDRPLLRVSAVVRAGHDRRGREAPEWPVVSIGRTDSKRRLGFGVQVSPRKASIRFTLDRVQVVNLRDFLVNQLRRLRRRRVR